MTITETLKLALEALRKARRKVLTTEECHAVIMSIKEALASEAIEQPAQQEEPVAWMYELIVDGDICQVDCTTVNWNPEYQPFGRAGINFKDGGKVTKTPLYASPPTLSLAQRQARSADTWVGLTESEITTSLPYSVTRDKGCFHAGALWAEAKLKEKNT